jgi:hypothetical protein
VATCWLVVTELVVDVERLDEKAEDVVAVWTVVVGATYGATLTVKSCEVEATTCPLRPFMT